MSHSNSIKSKAKLKGSCVKSTSWEVVVLLDEIDVETHFAQLGSCRPGGPKMSRKLVHSFGHLAVGLHHLAQARGDQSCALIFETFLALLARGGRVGQNEFHH